MIYSDRMRSAEDKTLVVGLFEEVIDLSLLAFVLFHLSLTLTVFLTSYFFNDCNSGLSVTILNYYCC